MIFQSGKSVPGMWDSGEVWRTGLEDVDEHLTLPRTAVGSGAVRLVDPGSCVDPKVLPPDNFSVPGTKWTVSRAARAA